MSTECEFCSELAYGHMHPEIARRVGPKGRIVLRTRHFGMMPSLSPITAGHVLIVPTNHVTSLAQLNSDVRVKLIELVKAVCHRISVTWGRTVISEHGVGCGKTDGCGVSHAHLHIIPLAQEHEVILTKQLESELGHGKRCSFTDALRELDSHQSYLLFGSLKEVVLFDRDNVPSQIVRQKLAQSLRISDWDWRSMFAWDVFDRTLAQLNASVS